MLIKPLVFADFHHSSLLNSLIMLFEGRLGGQVYRPIGMEWAEQGFWKVYDHPATQLQFLGVGGATPDGTKPLNEVEGIGGKIGIDGKRIDIYHCKDIEGDRTNKAITLEGFLNMPFDVVIASIPQHIEPFKKLCELHPNHPKLIFQIGNAWTIEAGLAPNIMASAIINDVPENIHFISYHQEFDTKVFYPDFSRPGQTIYSFINVFNNQPHLAEDWQLFQEVEHHMSNWTFRSFGGQCRDGSMDGSENLANKMREARFIWHTKAGGDGYGHVLHNSAAVGRPIITKKLYYAGKMGEKLMIDGETCIAIDGLTAHEIISKIEYYSDPPRYEQMCRAVYENFHQVCDFDKEFESLQIFLNNLI